MKVFFITLNTLVLLFFILGCTSTQRVDSRVGAEIGEKLGNCLNTTSQTEISICAKEMFIEINQRIPDSDPSKPAGLNSARKMFELLRQFEEGRINSKDMQSGFMRIANESRQESMQAEQKAAELVAAESRRRRELFLNAHRILSQPYSNTPVMTCTPQAGLQNGTFVCN
jgi:hypothetical protein